MLEALGNADAIHQVVKDTFVERQFLEVEVSKFPFLKKIFPSNANFILIKVDGARAIYEFLIEQTIIIRDRSKVVLCEDCLRVSVGTREENEAFLKALNLFKP